MSLNASGAVCRESELVPASSLHWGLCSGNGVCVDMACVCNEGWTGRSDFVNAEGLDCHINQSAVRWIWIASMVLVNLVYLLSWRVLRERWEQHKALQARRRSEGKRFTWWENASLRSVVVYFTLCVTSFNAYALVKVLDAQDRERIGLTPLISALFFICVAGFFLGFFYFTIPLIYLLLRGGRGTGAGMTQLTYAFGLFFLSTELVASCLPLASALYLAAQGAPATLGDAEQQAAVSWACFRAFFILFAAALFGHTVQLFLALRQNAHVFSVSRAVDGQADWILDVQRSIRNVLLVAAIEACANAALYVGVLAWPLLWRMHDYFLPLSWTGATVIWFCIFHVFVRNNKPDRGIGALHTIDDNAPGDDRVMPSSLAALPSRVMQSSESVFSTVHESEHKPSASRV